MRRQDERELGFGTRVGAGRAGRLMNRDGSFNVRRHGMPLRSLVSLSHRLLQMRWPTFLALLTGAYLVLNGAFALVYFGLGEEAIVGPGPHGFARCFFFSVQTASTIGYGALVPGTTGSNLVATVEALAALISFALVSGLTYARFTRAVADVVFSKHAVIAPYQGGTAFEVRVGNRRRGQLLDLKARIFLSSVSDEGGQAKRTYHELTLERGHLSFLPLTWTLVHPIDAQSPLHGVSAEDLAACDVEVFVTLSAMEETFSQVVHARCSYKAEEILWNARFGNVFERSSTGIPTGVDLSRIHDVEPMKTP